MSVAWIRVTQIVDALSHLIALEPVTARPTRPAAAVASAALSVAVRLATALRDHIGAARPERLALRATGAPTRRERSAVALAGEVRGGGPTGASLTRLSFSALTTHPATTIVSTAPSFTSRLALFSADAVVAEELPLLGALATEAPAAVIATLSAITPGHALGAGAIRVARVAAAADHGVELLRAVGIGDATTTVTLDAVSERAERTGPRRDLVAPLALVRGVAGRQDLVAPADTIARLTVRICFAAAAVTEDAVLIQRPVTKPICRHAATRARATLLAASALTTRPTAAITSAALAITVRGALRDANAAHAIGRRVLFARPTCPAAAIISAHRAVA